MNEILILILSQIVTAAFTIGVLKTDIKWIIGTLKRHDLRINTLERKKT